MKNLKNKIKALLGYTTNNRNVYKTMEKTIDKSRELVNIEVHSEEVEREEKVEFNNRIKTDTLTIEDINIERILKELESNAWYGNGKTVTYIISGEDIIELYGYVYEPSYEFFSTAHSIVMNGKTLFAENSMNVEPYHNDSYISGSFKNTEEVLKYLKEYLKNKELIIQYDKPLELKNNDKQDEFEQSCLEGEEEEEF